MRARKLLAVVGLMLTVLIGGCSKDNPQHQELNTSSGPIMGTWYHLKWWVEGDLSLSPESVNQTVLSRLENVNRLMSTYKPDSELSNFNKSAQDRWFSLSRETFDVLLTAQRIADASEGALDIKLGSLVNLWGFGPESRPTSSPTEAMLQQALLAHRSATVELDESAQAIRKSGRFEIDLSSIAKGYAVDEGVRYLESLGVTNYLLEIGGEVRAAGAKPDGNHWKIAIEAPNPAGRDIQGVIELDGLAMATSGDYRNYFEENGTRFSHTIDPRTGKPIQHRLASVTVLHHDTASADGWATALLVLGDEAGVRVAKENGLAALFIVKGKAGFEEIRTTGFPELIRLQRN